MGSLGVFRLKDSYFNAQGEQTVHFGSESGFAAYGERVYFTDGRNAEVAVFRRTGGLLGLIRTDVEPTPVTNLELETLKAEVLKRVFGTREGSAAGRGRWRELMDQIPARDSMPVFSILLTDPLGNVWVESYRPPHRAAPWMAGLP